jgi:hypothetical protein
MYMALGIMYLTYSAKYPLHSLVASPCFPASAGPRPKCVDQLAETPQIVDTKVSAPSSDTDERICRREAGPGNWQPQHLAIPSPNIDPIVSPILATLDQFELTR